MTVHHTTMTPPSPSFWKDRFHAGDILGFVPVDSF